ncbi:MAG: hypothetical protein KUG64_10265 [Cycloclasticus sp.]|nr:hypothetical protein [Cycloclasticus sp.]
MPTRGDRSIFLSRCLQMIENQTMKADIVHLVSEEPKSKEKDITYRYKKGFKHLFNQGCEVVLLWEDDDFYANNYIEVMIKNWIAEGKPDVFGLGETVYYHLQRKVHMTMKHQFRSSAFSTMVTKSVLDIDFPADNYSFLDLEIWKQLNGKTFLPVNPICMGIKHGVGTCGGRGHLEDFPYTEEDPDSEFLKGIVGPMYNSYKNLVHQLK